MLAEALSSALGLIELTRLAEPTGLAEPTILAPNDCRLTTMSGVLTSTSCGLPATGCGLIPTGCGLLTTDCGLLTTDLGAGFNRGAGNAIASGTLPAGSARVAAGLSTAAGVGPESPVSLAP